MKTIAGLKAAARRAGLRRSRVAAARMCCERTLIARAVHGHQAKFGRILCYHSVGTPEWGVNDVPAAQFRRQIELALNAGYRFVPAGRIARGEGGSNELAITFDDGLTSVATNAAPVLAEFGIPWSLFVVSDWADARHQWGDGVLLGWREIERLAAAGAAIGSHSVTHPDFAALAAGEALEELAASRERIAARIGVQTVEFAIPLGQSHNWTAAAAGAARAAGYELVYAQSVQKRPQGTVPRTFITRFDGDRIFHAALAGRFDGWEEWL